MHHKYLALSFVCALSACSTAEPPATGSDASEQPMIERTIVHLADDGNDEVKTERITVAQRDLEWAAREQRLARGGGKAGGPITPELASLDSGCVGSSMWIFDSNNNSKGLPPFNHEICFYKISTAFPVCTDLRQYARQCIISFPKGSCSNWATDNGNWIGSFYSGKDSGMFLQSDGAVTEGFASYFRQDNAQNTLVSRSTYLCFPNN
jgi:hypothetical protein